MGLSGPMECFFMLLQYVFPPERFRTIREGTIISSSMFGAFMMAYHSAFTMCCIATFTAIKCATIGVERNRIRLASTNCGSWSGRTLSSSGTLHNRGRGHLRIRRPINGVSDFCVRQWCHRHGGGSRFLGAEHGVESNRSSEAVNLTEIKSARRRSYCSG